MGHAAPGSSRRSKAGRISLGLKVGDFCELFATCANWRSVRARATDCDIGLLAGDGFCGRSFRVRRKVMQFLSGGRYIANVVDGKVRFYEHEKQK